MTTRISLLGMAAAVSVLGFAASAARAADEHVQVSGMIVSIRNNIVEVRPSLRPKWTRVAIGDKTTILDDEQAKKDDLKPGQRIWLGGIYSKEDGFHPLSIEFAENVVGYLAEKSNGLEFNDDHSRARCNATLKSVKPFVFTTDDKQDHPAKLDQLHEVLHLASIPHNGLLIGTRINVDGTRAPDGVVRADSISPDHGFAKAGTMFGKIMAVKDNVLEVRPRYTTDTIEVAMDEPCSIQRQIPIDPDSVKIGDTVTFWGNWNNRDGSNRLRAFALLIGEGRFPHAANGEGGGVFLTGKIASLDPVKLTLPDGTATEIAIPAQMPVATLQNIDLKDVHERENAMLILSRTADGGFHTKIIVLDASPWVGYGW